jgi:hypothetical protein
MVKGWMLTMMRGLAATVLFVIIGAIGGVVGFSIAAAMSELSILLAFGAIVYIYLTGRVVEWVYPNIK